MTEPCAALLNCRRLLQACAAAVPLWGDAGDVRGPEVLTGIGTPSTNNHDTLSTYEQRGKRIPYRIDAVWHGTRWSEQTEADWVEQFNTLCYSMPQVNAITRLDFTEAEYMPNGGLFARDLRPKPSRERLLELGGGLSWELTERGGRQ